MNERLTVVLHVLQHTSGLDAMSAYSDSRTTCHIQGGHTVTWDNLHSQLQQQHTWKKAAMKEGLKLEAYLQCLLCSEVHFQYNT